jgi:hypothetical protein
MIDEGHYQIWRWPVMMLHHEGNLEVEKMGS